MLICVEYYHLKVNVIHAQSGKNDQLLILNSAADIMPQPHAKLIYDNSSFYQIQRC